MPVYEYLCHDCGKGFSIVQSIHQHEAAEEVACETCGSVDVERRWSPVSVETSRKS